MSAPGRPRAISRMRSRTNSATGMLRRSAAVLTSSHSESEKRMPRVLRASVGFSAGAAPVSVSSGSDPVMSVLHVTAGTGRVRGQIRCRGTPFWLSDCIGLGDSAWPFTRICQFRRGGVQTRSRGSNGERQAQPAQAECSDPLYLIATVSAASTATAAGASRMAVAGRSVFGACLVG